MRTQLRSCSRRIQELLRSGDERRNRRPVGQPVPRRPPVRTDRDEATLKQERQVFTHGRLGQADVFDQISDTMLSPGQVLKHGQTRGLSEGVEEMSIDSRRRFVEDARRRFDFWCPAIHRHKTMMLPQGDESQRHPQLIPITTSERRPRSLPGRRGSRLQNHREPRCFREKPCLPTLDIAQARSVTFLLANHRFAERTKCRFRK